MPHRQILQPPDGSSLFSIRPAVKAIIDQNRRISEINKAKTETDQHDRDIKEINPGASHDIAGSDGGGKSEDEKSTFGTRDGAANK